MGLETKTDGYRVRTTSWTKADANGKIEGQRTGTLFSVKPRRLGQSCNRMGVTIERQDPIIEMKSN